MESGIEEFALCVLNSSESDFVFYHDVTVPIMVMIFWNRIDPPGNIANNVLRLAPTDMKG
jgi:hypothetical protein